MCSNGRTSVQVDPKNLKIWVNRNFADINETGQITTDFAQARDQGAKQSRSKKDRG